LSAGDAVEALAQMYHASVGDTAVGCCIWLSVLSTASR